MRLLYVEDHATFAAQVVERCLVGATVRVVPSLAQARDLLAEDVFDALLVDYDLEDGKGATLVRELRACGDRVRIVAVSAHDMGNSELVRAGADAICKKADLESLRDVLRRLGVEFRSD